jgi:hypothetical protein
MEVPPTRWSFLGERFCSFYEGGNDAVRPQTPLTITGQVSPAPSGVVAYGPFVVYAHDTRIDLLTDVADTVFLEKCLSAGLRCWATGQLITHARVRIMNCERVFVWHVGSRTSLAAIPGAVLHALATAARDTALARWAHSLPLPSGQEHALHPVAYEGVSRYLASTGFAEEGSTAGLLPAAHLEATSRCGSSALRLDSHLQLGTSELFFCPATQTCLIGSPPLASAFRPVRAGLIVADQSEALLGLLRHVARLDLSLETGGAPGGRLLVLAPRRAMPGVLATLEALRPLLLCSRQDLAASDLAAASLVVASQDLLQSPATAGLLQGPWSRIVQVGWPQTCCGALLRADFVLALALHVEVRELLQRGISASLQDLALLFGLDPNELNDARALTALMTYRVFHLQRPRSAQQVRKYSYQCLSQPPSPHAPSMLSGRRQYREERALLFGRLGAPERVAFPAVTDALRHFQSRGGELTDFARASLGASAEEGDRCCPVCFDERPDTATRCGHWFCHQCLESALRVHRGCPVCKAPLQARRDVAVPRSAGAEEPPTGAAPGLSADTPEMLRLLDLLQARAACEKVLVLACFGEVHSSLAARLRARQVNAAVWRGNSRQLLQARAVFERWRSGVLFVDGAAVDTRWVRFSDVRRVVLVMPLQARAIEACCQIRDALGCCDARVIEVVGRGADPVLPEQPLCDQPNCPILVHTSTSAT